MVIVKERASGFYGTALVAHLTLCPEDDLARPLGVLVVTGRYAGFVARSTSENRATLETQLEAAGAPEPCG